MASRKRRASSIASEDAAAAADTHESESESAADNARAGRRKHGAPEALPPFHHGADGKQHARRVRVAGHTYDVGDCMHMLASDWYTEAVGDEEACWVARLDDVIVAGKRNVQVVCTWLYTPDETGPGRTSADLVREVLLTGHTDTNTAEAIVRPASVIPVYNPAELSDIAAANPRSYICRCFYDPATQQRRLLHPGELTHAGASAPVAGSGDDDDAHKESSGRRASTAAAHVSSRGERRRTREDALSALASAAAALSLTTVPEALPGRDRERDKIRGIVLDSLLSRHAGTAVYVSGMPGTGKTATVRDIMKELVAMHEQRTVPAFVYGEINGLAMETPQQVFSRLYAIVTGGKFANPIVAQRALDERFRGEGSEGKKPAIVLVDELDCLVTRSQAVLYTLFDWACTPDSGLVLICIANTMDLPERLLPKIASRLGQSARISFKAYDAKLLQEITNMRLKKVPVGVIDPQAVTLASKKASAITGDARRVLHVCRRAVQLAEARVRESTGDVVGQYIVTMEDIGAAARELHDGAFSVLLQNAPPLTQAVAGIVARAATTGLKMVPLSELQLQVQQVAARMAATMAIGGTSASSTSATGASDASISVAPALPGRDAYDWDFHDEPAPEDVAAAAAHADLVRACPASLRATAHALYEAKIIELGFPWASRALIASAAQAPAEIESALLDTPVGKAIFYDVETTPARASAH